jgi:hypothetical protein
VVRWAWPLMSMAAGAPSHQLLRARQSCCAGIELALASVRTSWKSFV